MLTLDIVVSCEDGNASCVTDAVGMLFTSEMLVSLMAVSEKGIIGVSRIELE